MRFSVAGNQKKQRVKLTHSCRKKNYIRVSN
jgi:hypothetical protein